MMADIAKVLLPGRSQAVRLAKKHRFDRAEVEVTCRGDALILRPCRTETRAHGLAACQGLDDATFDDMFQRLDLLSQAIEPLPRSPS